VPGAGAGNDPARAKATGDVARTEAVVTGRDLARDEAALRRSPEDEPALRRARAVTREVVAGLDLAGDVGALRRARAVAGASGTGPPIGNHLASFATTINLVVAKNGGLHVVRVNRASPKSFSTLTS
jgi:hypothetical protein